MRISDWSSDVCSSDLKGRPRGVAIARLKTIRRSMVVRITKSMLKCSETGDDDCLASPPACGQVVPAIVRSPIRVSPWHLPPLPAGHLLQLVNLACLNSNLGHIMAFEGFEIGRASCRVGGCPHM